MPTPRRALVSVFDKRDLETFVRGLIDVGFEILSTGGTLQALHAAGLPATAVSDVTGFPEILDGRVKTLHPKIHGGILADRSRPEHSAQIAEHGIAPIDLVVVNLYAFREAAAKPGAARAEVVEMIDIGGPAMVRAAAKNHGGVGVVVDPSDYAEVLSALKEGDGTLPEDLRRRLAAKAFRHTADYDAAIARWMEESGEPERFPAALDLALDRVLVPRYGENPHQRAAVYATRGGLGVFGGFTSIQGKELSWNNLLDADAARRIVGQFDQPAVAIIKHNNPCGVGLGDDLPAAYLRALATDPVSAFGSILAVNAEVGADFAEAIADLFVEVLVAPGFSSAALERFAAKKNLRLVACPLHRPLDRAGAGPIELRAISGGYLAQDADDVRDHPTAWTLATRRAPSDEERRALELAWKVGRYVKSNAIVVANPIQTVGIGAGQMSRLDSCRIATEKARQFGLDLAGTAASSDAFFPFRDGLDALATAGITAIVQPGGSKRDDEVIAAADEQGLAMLLTGVRHFRH
ncbi:MAG TPA: bifunctional phosphoribosylaminoimidazolecarboxamide formyltransferase/IMP cyclohydrolase [Thermoanaerobaculia bacterium]|jgi:phosphoribosylaminoimidazolecarboxamide formyltransferase/IMP cyclohydrolase|nr:bifunctional phosphoribosylaminoimidazolecarboxamide formyltransferase/IMP cyclohydrolase [Thermoanaerobaculia bacterium]